LFAKRNVISTIKSVTRPYW